MTATAQSPGDGPTREKILDVYLNDHLAGATAGTRLARRMVREHHDTEYGVELEKLAAEIAQDKRYLLRILSDLEMPVQHYKQYGARLGEKLGRVKPNGRLLRRSGLTVLVELEAVRLGVQGKALLWRALLSASAEDPRLDADWLRKLEQRAEQQLRTLDALHQRAAATLLAAEPDVMASA
ncbi:hypothetical protein [Streptomyces sp. NPDC001388]|uniref:hypothetical protein n=1 Tax=unclassified Streptomyces TaxID=2593676 RepID=UPI003691CED1